MVRIPLSFGSYPTNVPLLFTPVSIINEFIRHPPTSGTNLQITFCPIKAVRRKLPEIAKASVAPAKVTPAEESTQDSELVSPEPLILSPLWAKLPGLSPRTVVMRLVFHGFYL